MFIEYIQIINFINVATRHVWVISIPMLMSDKIFLRIAKTHSQSVYAIVFIMPQLLQIVLGV